LLERLLHNTEDGFFFLKKDSHPELIEDLCVFLALSVAIRADQYEACLTAKIAQMDHIFAAKVGWLVGNLYSRIGTPDVEEKIANSDEYKGSSMKRPNFADCLAEQPRSTKPSRTLCATGKHKIQE
jgi:hypothetical protein